VTGVPSTRQPSARPRHASANCHMTAGSRRTEVEAVRDRQRLRAGRRDIAVRLRRASARRVRIQLRETGRCRRLATATPRLVSSSIRMTQESSGCAPQHRVALHEAVYWSVIHALDAWFGELTSRSTCLRSSSESAGRGSAFASSACSASATSGTGERPLVRGPFVRDRPRRHVHDLLAGQKISSRVPS